MVALLFVIWPLVELFVVVKVAEAIGVLYTILLLLASWPLGSWALRSQGAAAWRRLSIAVAEGRRPGREVVNGALILLGGILLLIPGFISDLIGLSLLAPPTRVLLRAALIRNLQSRFVTRAVRMTSTPYDVESTARDIDQPTLRP
jgi:UPF0716 protein FxsA